MPATHRHHELPLARYFDVECSSPERFEHLQGSVLAMSGASLEHKVVSMNILVLLKAGSKAGCLVLGNDQRIATGDGHYTYPDASVICGKPELTRLRGTDTLHNPSALAEVLSDSTRDYDLRERREHYQATPSVQDVPFADIEARTLRHVRRRGARWTTREATGDKEVRLACGAWVRAAEVFEGMG